MHVSLQRRMSSAVKLRLLGCEMCKLHKLHINILSLVL